MKRFSIMMTVDQIGYIPKEVKFATVLSTNRMVATSRPHIRPPISENALKNNMRPNKACNQPHSATLKMTTLLPASMNIVSLAIVMKPIIDWNIPASIIRTAVKYTQPTHPVTCFCFFAMELPLFEYYNTSIPWGSYVTTALQ